MSDLESRIEELQKLHWKKQQAIAANLGLEKPDDVPWEDFCQAIAEAEAAQVKTKDTRIESPEPKPPSVAVVGVDAEVPFQPFRGAYCPNCNNKFLTDLGGKLFCPVKHKQCPHNSGAN